MKKKPRSERLNTPQTKPLPEGVNVQAWRTEPVVHSRDKAREDPERGIATMRFDPLMDATDTEDSISEVLSRFETRALRVFTENEGDPRSIQHATWIPSGPNAGGGYGTCRTKYGDFARELLMRIARYRYLSDREQRSEKSLRLIEIGRLSMLLEMIEHEEDASLGSDKRKATAKSGNKRRDIYTDFIESEHLEEKVNDLIAKGHSLKRARELVANRAIPPWRKESDGSGLTEATLRRRNIGGKRKV